VCAEGPVKRVCLANNTFILFCFILFHFCGSNINTERSGEKEKGKERNPQNQKEKYGRNKEINEDQIKGTIKVVKKTAMKRKKKEEGKGKPKKKD
jgi:hypothetical protein